MLSRPSLRALVSLSFALALGAGPLTSVASAQSDPAPALSPLLLDGATSLDVAPLPELELGAIGTLEFVVVAGHRRGEADDQRLQLRNRNELHRAR